MVLKRIIRSSPCLRPIDICKTFVDCHFTLFNPDLLYCHETRRNYRPTHIFLPVALFCPSVKVLAVAVDFKDPGTIDTCFIREIGLQERDQNSGFRNLKDPVFPSFSKEVCLRLFLTDLPVIREPVITAVSRIMIITW